LPPYWGLDSLSYPTFRVVPQWVPQTLGSGLQGLVYSTLYASKTIEHAVLDCFKGLGVPYKPWFEVFRWSPTLMGSHTKVTQPQ